MTVRHVVAAGRVAPHDGMRLRVAIRGGVDKYPAKSHARRVAANLGVDEGVLALSGQRLVLYPDSDQAAPFRQDRYFYYLSGCNEPNCHVTYDLGADKLTLWLPPIDKARVVWVGRGSTVDEALEKYDIDEAKYVPSDAVGSRRSSDALKAIVASWRRDQGALSAARAFFGDAKKRALAYSLKALPGDQALMDSSSLRRAMVACRVVKDEHEIGLIRTANAITTEAHVNIMKKLHSFSNEAEAEAAYMQVCIARHAKAQAYAPIVGSGVNGSVLHYDGNQADFNDGQTIVVDAGCEVSCYASDVTRTLPLNKANPGHWPSAEAEKIYGLVEEVQEKCIAYLRPGVPFYALRSFATTIIAQGLLALGVLKGDIKDVLRAGTAVAFFPHGLGHHVGLEVHDVDPVLDSRVFPTFTTFATEEELATHIHGLHEGQGMWDRWTESLLLNSHEAERFGQPASTTSPPTGVSDKLEAGMVVTVEPGIYFNEYLLKEFFLSNPVHSKYIDTEILQRYMPVGGIRIEDDILITKNGHENLTATPKGKQMLEIIRVGAQRGTQSLP